MRLKVLITVLVVLAACGNDAATDAGSEPTTVATEPGAEPTSQPSEEPADTTEVTLWVAYGEYLHPLKVRVDSTPRIGTAALQALAGLEQGSIVGNSDFATAFPSGVDVNGLTIDGGVATADLSRSFEAGGGSLAMRLRLGSLVYTLTEFPTVKRVMLKLDGSAIEAFSGEGIVVADGVTRKDFADLVAPIVVESPSPNDEVSGPIEITGTANVFEATVSIRIVDPSGKELYSGFTTATCGTGCRGDYVAEAEVDVDEPTEAVIEVYSASAEDGSPMHVVEVPVTIQP
jgi:spore germination protein GerM